ncbi:hypothetical protein ACQRBV_25395 [Pseudomonas sp. R11F]|nr:MULTISPECIES: hypothetical protein [Pseudomonas]
MRLPFMMGAAYCSILDITPLPHLWYGVDADTPCPGSEGFPHP